MQVRTGKKAEMRFCYIEFSKSGTACFFVHLLTNTVRRGVTFYSQVLS